MVALDLVAMRAFLDETGLERLEHRMEHVRGGLRSLAPWPAGFAPVLAEEPNGLMP